MRRASDKFRPSRAMLPGEFLCAGFALALTWSGGAYWPLRESLLHTVLEKGGDTFAWVFGLGLPSIGILFLSASEWLFGQGWSCKAMNKSCCWRGKMVASMGLGWIYAFYLLGQNVEHMNAVFLQCLFGFAFCGWSYWENRRVQREIRNHQKQLQLVT